ncbi:MAG: hypothetical protein DRI86_08580 [Bacteroidetes bacterium]|nr:MAG: hypothetical protein DRI86_08580 [Bacteroidota bacterium]
MKLYILSVLLFCSFVVNAQSNQELLFFNSNGYVQLVREDTIIKNIQGEKFLQNDLLRIISGDATIINLNNKRVTIEKSGNYNYNDVLALMQHTESSLSNKYFVYVWDKMSDHKKNINKPGGVIRGDGFITFPMDSVIILSDTVRFCINNESGGDYQLIIKSDNHNIIKQNPIGENITLNIRDINEGKPGKYYWEIKIPFGKPPAKKYFIIPNEKTKNEMLAEYKKNISEFSSFNIEMRELLTKEYITQNKIYF